MQFFPRAQPGQKLKIGAEPWNAAMDAAEWYLRTKMPGGTPPALLARDLCILPIMNNSGCDVPAGGILAIDSPPNFDANYPDRFRFAPLIQSTQAVAGSDDVGTFCIAVEPIAKGLVGNAAFSGCVPALIYCPKAISDPSQEPATADVGPDNAAAGYLEPSSGGAATVLWGNWQTAPGLCWALVRFGGGGETLTPFELQGSLAPGGSAAAYPMKWDQSTQSVIADTSAQTLTVYDYVGDKHGAGRDAMPTGYHGSRGVARVGPSGNLEILTLEQALVWMWLTQDLSPALTAAPASPSNPNPSQSTAQANPMNWVPTANAGMGGLVADPNATFTVVEATGVYGFPKGAKVLCRPLVRYNPSFNAAVCYWEVVEAPPLFVDFELYYDMTPKGVDIIAWPLVVDSQSAPTKLTRDASTNPPTLKVSDLVLKNCRAYGSQHGGFSNGAQGVARWEKTLNKWCVISLQNLSKRCSATAYSSFYGSTGTVSNVKPLDDGQSPVVDSTTQLSVGNPQNYYIAVNSYVEIEPDGNGGWQLCEGSGSSSMWAQIAGTVMNQNADSPLVVSANPCWWNGGGVDATTSLTLKTPLRTNKATALFAGDVVEYRCQGTGDLLVVSDCFDDRIGTIKAWSGSQATIPKGWKEYTQASGRTLIGVNTGQTDESSIGASGGYRWHGQTENNHPDHKVQTLQGGTLPSLNTDGNWPKMDGGAWPTLNNGSWPALQGGALPSMNPGTAGSFSPGSQPSYTPGTLPSLSPGSFPSITGGSWPSLDPGSLPSLGSFPSVTLAGSWPTFDPGAFPGLSGGSVGTFLLTQSPVQLPSCCSGGGMQAVAYPIDWDFTSGTLPTLSGGRLPSLTGSWPTLQIGSWPQFNPGTLPGLGDGSWQILCGGALPTLDSGALGIFNPGLLATLTWPTEPTLNTGSFPTMGTGTWQTINAGTWPNMAGGSWPTFNHGAFPYMSGDQDLTHKGYYGPTNEDTDNRPPFLTVYWIIRVTGVNS